MLSTSFINAYPSYYQAYNQNLADGEGVVAKIQQFSKMLHTRNVELNWRGAGFLPTQEVLEGEMEGYRKTVKSTTEACRRLSNFFRTTFHERKESILLCDSISHLFKSNHEIEKMEKRLKEVLFELELRLADTIHHPLTEFQQRIDRLKEHKEVGSLSTYYWDKMVRILPTWVTRETPSEIFDDKGDEDYVIVDRQEGNLMERLMSLLTGWWNK